MFFIWLSSEPKSWERAAHLPSRDVMPLCVMAAASFRCASLVTVDYTLVLGEWQVYTFYIKTAYWLSDFGMHLSAVAF